MNYIHRLSKPALELGEENRWALLRGFDYPVMVVQLGETAALIAIDAPEDHVDDADALIESLGLMPPAANLFELDNDQYAAFMMAEAI